ncbi:MAG: hypothetical protein K6G75_07150 [Lachnospiraceae bacterium]|nr:hypothetical protein [Lachnospiraceae bacterium]
MRKKVLGLFVSDLSYMEKLHRYLDEDRKITFTLCVFTSEEKLVEYLEREKIDFLLASEDRKEQYKGVGKIIYIHEEPQKDGICKYAPGNEVVERLTEIIGIDEMQNEDVQVGKTTFIGVYSPVARSMKTSFCMVLGQMLAKKNRVLYLNFESFSGMSVNERMGGKGDLADLLYYFNNIKQEFISKFKNSLINHNGLDMIKPAYYYLDLSYITPDKWDKFMDELSEMSEFDYIILDLSDYLQGLFDSFLTRCSIIYTMTANDSRAQSKIFHYEQILNEYNYEDILQKTRKFTIPSVRNLPMEIDRLLYTELVDYVKKATMADFNW